LAWMTQERQSDRLHAKHIKPGIQSS
jgi:hypothetical protein